MTAPWGLFVVLVFFTPTVHSSGGDTVLYNSVTGCSSQVRLNPGNIIDIRASVSRGAELLLGGWESSLSNCVASCCHMDRCDLVLFKNVGLSQSGRNCYFIHCGSSDNCVTVSHEGFTSASITPSDGTKAPTTDTEITSSPPPTTSEPPHMTSPTTHMVSQTASVTTMATTTPTMMSTTTTTSTTTTSPPSTTVSAVSNTTGSPVTHTTPPTTNTPGDGATQAVNTTTDSESVNSNQANQSPPGETDIIVTNVVVPEDECSLDGCDGSGAIVVAVVGSLCVMIIMVVIIVILKRLLNDKKKKRFRNVDYLINGMYT